jgi:RNA polymerase sigma-70 factor (ECF subfamily)
MPQGSQPAVEISEAIASLTASLYERSGAAKVGLAKDRFCAILEEVAVKYLPQTASVHDRQELFSSLKVEDLALAHACAEGSEKAWEVFMLRFREKLYDIAGYIAKESSAGRELADSLYADLYGTTTREGKRACKLSSYTGRGSLEGWLRTVLSQEYVNRYRKQKRLVSLDEESEEGEQFATPEKEETVAVDPRLEAVTDEALAALPAEDRFALAAYYLDGRTLAEIAKMLGVHESTISRKLDKLAKALRKQILAGLAKRGMDRRQAQEALDVDVRDLKIAVRTSLAQETRVQTFPDKKAEASTGDGV